MSEEKYNRIEFALKTGTYLKLNINGAAINGECGVTVIDEYDCHIFVPYSSFDFYRLETFADEQEEKTSE